MHFEIVHPIHTGMHHELHFESGCLTRFESHRTDGRGGWSASLHDFNIWGLGEAQGLVTHVRQLERDIDRATQLNIA